MQEDLHPRSQRPHWVHLVVSMVGRKRAKRLTRPRVVPTGQMVLQYSRPQSQAQQPMTTSVTRPVISSGRVMDPFASPTILRTTRP